MISVLPGFHDFICIELFLNPVYCLFGTVIPASVDPYLTLVIFPGSEDLSNSWFIWVVWIDDVNPVT